MNDGSLETLRDLLRDRPHGLTFADLPETVLEDLALGWLGGRPTAQVAAELASRIDGIPVAGRAREIAGRALLTLLARRGAPLELAATGEQVRLLGNPTADEGDPEGDGAYARREEEYASLAALPHAYSPAEYAADLEGAFAAARERAGAAALPTDEVAARHRLALLHMGLPAGLRSWFHERYDADRADVLAWKFVLVGRALARHREAMLETGVATRAAGDEPVPQRLVSALLELDLAELAKTAVLVAV